LMIVIGMRKKLIRNILLYNLIIKIFCPELLY